MGRMWDSVCGGTVSGIDLGKSIKTLNTSRKNVNPRKKEVVGSLKNVPETWEVRYSQDSKGGTLNEMPDSRERKIIKPITCSKLSSER